mgnify:FL=1
MLPTPEDIRLNLDNVFLALQDMVQVELIRTRWKEIKTLSGLQSASGTKKLLIPGSSPIPHPALHLANTT